MFFTNDEILSLIKTVSDRNEFLHNCDRMIRQMYTRDGDILTFIKTNFPYEQERAFMMLFKKYPLPLTDKTQMQDFFTKLQQQLTSLPVVTLTLAFKPTSAHIATISEWLLREYHTLILIDLLYDPNIIGGTIVACNGFRKDYSVRRVLLEKTGKL